MNTDVLIVFVSALLAAVSFMAFALPFLQNTEKKERYRSVIEKKRKSLFEQAKEQQKNRGKRLGDSLVPDSKNPSSPREVLGASFSISPFRLAASEKIQGGKKCPIKVQEH